MRASDILRIGLVVTGAWCLPAAGQGTSNSPTTGDLRGYYSGNGLLQRGMFDQAAEEYRRFLSAHAEHEKAPTARYGLAVCLFRKDRFDDALTELEKLADIADFAYAAEVLTMTGQCRMAQKDYGKAAAAFEEVVADHEGHKLAAEAACQLVEALYRAGRHEDALAAGARIARQWGESPLGERSGFFAGLAASALGRDDEAATRLAAVLDQWPKGSLRNQTLLLLAQCRHRTGDLVSAAKGYRELIGKDAPQRIDALYGLGILLLSQSNWDDAGKILDEYLKDGASHPMAATGRIARARVALEKGEIDQAIINLEAGEKLSGAAMDEIAYWKAKCELRRDRHAQAVALLEQAIEATPASKLAAEMNYDRGVALVRAGRTRRAAEALESFLGKYPDHGLAAEALHLLATTQHLRRKYDESLGCCSKFLEQYGQHPLAAEVMFLAAENEFLAARHEKAEAAYRRFLKAAEHDEQSLKATYRLALALYYLKKFDEAAPLLEKAVLQKDALARASCLPALGDIYFSRGEWKKAEAALRSFVETKPTAGFDEALIKLGLACQRQEKLDDAVVMLDRLINECPKSPHRVQAVFEKGQILLKRGDAKTAEAQFEIVLESGDPRLSPYALQHLSAIALSRGDSQRAAELSARWAKSAPSEEMKGEAALRRGQSLVSAGKYEEAATILSGLLEKHPDDPQVEKAKAFLAIATARQDKPDAAAELIAELDLAKLDDGLRSAVLYENAWCLKKLDRSEEAAKAYHEIINARTPSSQTPSALLELAALEMDQKRYAEAAKLLQKLLSPEGKDAQAADGGLIEQAMYRLGVCAFEQGRMDQAAEQFAGFVERFPQATMASNSHWMCGEANFKLGRHENALKHLAHVVKDEKSPDAAASAQLRMGESSAALARWADSEKSFEAFTKKYPGHAQVFQALFGIGWAYENQGRYDDAIRAYQRVIEAHTGPTAARAQFQIGECLFAQKKYDDAAAELLKVDILYGYPEWSAAALYEAGRCFEKLGKQGEAREQFNHVMEKHAQTHWGKLAADRLKAVSAAAVPGR